jgi:hypothetical protein
MLKLRSWFLLVITLCSNHAFSQGVATLGYSVLEQGDDRYQGGGFATVLVGDLYIISHFHRRKFLPVEQQTYSLAMGKRISLFGRPEFQLGYGGVVLLEKTQIRYSKDKDQAFNREENQFNFGLALGFFWEKSLGNSLHYTLGWEAYLFPAGEAFLFLATGRKQFLSAGMGVEW